MKIWVCSLVFLLISGCQNDDALSRVCGNVRNYCYAVWSENPEGFTSPKIKDKETANALQSLAKKGLIGECSLGTPTCNELGEITNCKGEVFPVKEVCDGLDNDCNGRVDEGINAQQSQYFSGPEEDNACILKYGSVLGECSHALVECVDGKFACTEEYTDIEFPQEYSCDLKDNDCDGKVDDEIFSGEFCWGGPEEDWWMATNGICRVGTRQCAAGEVLCVGDVLPSIETCDSKDNNCDGIVDNTEGILATNYDIVFIIDTSASMCGEIGAIAAALETYVSQFEENVNYRFAIVNMSAATDSRIEIVEPFTDLSTIRSNLLSIGCSGRGEEASLDSINMVCDISDPLGLQWRTPVNRFVFVFTDELPQSFETPPLTDGSVAETCMISQTVPVIWSSVSSEFQEIVSSNGGTKFLITSDWERIFEDLNSIIESLCTE